MYLAVISVVLGILTMIAVVLLSSYIRRKDAKSGLMAIARRYHVAELDENARPVKCSILLVGWIPHLCTVGMKLSEEVLILHEKPLLGITFPGPRFGIVAIPLSHIDVLDRWFVLPMLRRISIAIEKGHCELIMDVSKNDFDDIRDKILQKKKRDKNDDECRSAGPKNSIDGDGRQE